jgi:hypothetical protein
LTKWAIKAGRTRASVGSNTWRERKEEKRREEKSCCEFIGKKKEKREASKP